MSTSEQKFNVEWRRPNDAEVLKCHDLTAELLAFKIRAAIRNYGSVELLSLTPTVSTAPNPRSKG